MANVKEIRRQVMYNSGEGMSCGPVGVTSIDAEIVVEDNEETVYLHGQWVDTVGDEIYYEATKASVFEIYRKLNLDEGDFDKLIAERNKIVEETTIKEDAACSRYRTFYEDLKNMILEEMNTHGIECSLNSDEEDDF